MKFDYTPEKNQIIIDHENKILKNCRTIIKGYEPIFARYNCVIKIGQWWGDFVKNNGRRPPFENRYACYIYCNIERHGEVIRYDDKDGEVDYYELSVSWPVSSIVKHCSMNPFKKSHLMVSLFEDINDIVNDLNEFLKILGDVT